MGKLDEFLSKAVNTHAQNNSQHLGDRTEYIGASDIAGCPRKAVMSRLRPKPHSFATLLRFAWGHAAQALFRDIFVAGGMKPGENFEEEAELSHPDNPRIKCHIDFLFKSNQRLHVVEKKATKHLPNTAYDSWVNQIHVQMGLLKLHPMAQGKQIGGSILATEPLPRDSEENDQPGYKEYNSFEPDDLVFAHMMKKGEHILACIDGKEKPDVEPGPLCGSCAYSGDCPSRTGDQKNIPSEILEAAQEHEQLRKQKNEIEKKLDGLKEIITDFTGRKFSGETNGTALVVTTVSGREFVDLSVLKNKYPAAFEASKRKSRGWTSITVQLKPSTATETLSA